MMARPFELFMTGRQPDSAVLRCRSGQQCARLNARTEHLAKCVRGRLMSCVIVAVAEFRVPLSVLCRLFLPDTICFAEQPRWLLHPAKRPPVSDFRNAAPPPIFFPCEAVLRRDLPRLIKTIWFDSENV